MTKLQVFPDMGAAGDASPTAMLKDIPGAMWRDPEMDVDGLECWAIVLPNGTIWYTTERAGASGNRWTVTGEPPNITVTPSIDDRDPNRPWHGWIRDGEFVTA